MTKNNNNKTTSITEVIILLVVFVTVGMTNTANVQDADIQEGLIAYYTYDEINGDLK